MSIFTNPDIIPETVKLPKARNFMKEVVFHGCARPWYVYVETFFPAFLKLFVTLIFFDFDDLVREYGTRLSKTRGSGSRRHGRVSREITKAFLETKLQKRTRQGLRIVLRVTAPLEAAGFLFLMVAAGDEFFSDWQGLIERSPFCTNPIGTGPFSRSMVPTVLSVSVTGQGFGYDILEQNRGNWFNTPFSVAPASGPLLVFACLSGRANQGGLSKAALLLRISIGGVETQHRSGFESVGPGADVAFVTRARRFVPIGQPVTVTWELIGDTQLAAITVDEGSVFAMIEAVGINL